MQLSKESKPQRQTNINKAHYSLIIDRPASKIPLKNLIIWNSVSKY